MGVRQFGCEALYQVTGVTGQSAGPLRAMVHSTAGCKAADIAAPLPNSSPRSDCEGATVSVAPLYENGRHAKSQVPTLAAAAPPFGEVHHGW
jgi:hypothetical protein